MTFSSEDVTLLDMPDTFETFAPPESDLHLDDDLPSRNELVKAREGYCPPPMEMALGEDGIPTPVHRSLLETLPATGENFICQVGPCRHYVDMLVPSEDSEPHPELRRFCLRLQAGNELMELTEGSIMACSAYEPPPSTPGAFEWKVRSERLLAEARSLVPGGAAGTVLVDSPPVPEEYEGDEIDALFQKEFDSVRRNAEREDAPGGDDRGRENGPAEDGRGGPGPESGDRG